MQRNKKNNVYTAAVIPPARFEKDFYLLFNAFGGKSNGDKQRPSLGEMQAVLAQAVLEASEAKQLGLNSLVSVDAGDEQRASRLCAARNGLDAREK